MNVLLDIFAPYLQFIVFSITMVFNITLVYKRVSWYILIVANIILSLSLNFIGLGSYDLITQAVEYIVNILVDLVTALFNGILDLLESIISSIGEAIAGAFDIF